MKPYIRIYIYIYVRRRCIISNVSASKAYYYFLVPWREKGNVTRRNIEAGAYDDTPGTRTQSRCCRLRHSEGGWTCKSRDRRATFDSQMPARWVAAVIACNFCYRLRIEVSVLFFLFFPFSFLFFSSFFSFLFFSFSRVKINRWTSRRNTKRFRGPSASGLPGAGFYRSRPRRLSLEVIDFIVPFYPRGKKPIKLGKDK